MLQLPFFTCGVCDTRIDYSSSCLSFPQGPRTRTIWCPGWILSPLSLHSRLHEPNKDGPRPLHSGLHGKSELFLMPIGTTTSARYPRSFHCWYDLFRHSSPCLASISRHFHPVATRIFTRTSASRSGGSTHYDVRSSCRTCVAHQSESTLPSVWIGRSIRRFFQVS